MKTTLTNLENLQRTKDTVLAKFKANRLITLAKTLNITPNMITTVSVGFGLLSAYFLGFNHTLFAVLFITHQLLDALDGYYARLAKIESKLGNLLDHGGDVLVTYAFFAASVGILPEKLVITATLVYSSELLVLLATGWIKNKFPTRIFVYFYLFGLYRWGLLYQATYQLLSLTAFAVFVKKVFRSK